MGKHNLPWEIDFQQQFPDNPLDPDKVLGSVLGQVGGAVSQVEDAVSGAAAPPAPSPSSVPAPPSTPSTPVKAQIKATQNGLEIVKISSGTVGFFDKTKNYYKGLIVTVGSILVILNQVTPLFDFLGGDAQHWFTVVVAGATTVLAILKSNEQWVDRLPQSG